MEKIPCYRNTILLENEEKDYEKEIYPNIYDGYSDGDDCLLIVIKKGHNLCGD